MVQRVGEDDVLRPGERRQDAGVRRVPGIESHGGLGAFESGQLLFQGMVRDEVAADEAARARADAPAFHALRQRLADLGMRGEPEVVVRAEVDQTLAGGQLNLGPRFAPERLQRAQQAVRGNRRELFSCQRVCRGHGGAT